MVGSGVEPPASIEESRVRAQLLRGVVRYAPPWLLDHAEDIAQAAWLRLNRARSRDAANRDPGPSLLSRLAYCETVDEIRRRRRRREVPVEGLERSLASAASPPDRRAEAREIGEAIVACLAGLIHSRRLAVTLYLQGHSAPETGSLLGWSTKRAENLIFRGLADLRRCLATKGVRP